MRKKLILRLALCLAIAAWCIMAQARQPKKHSAAARQEPVLMHLGFDEAEGNKVADAATSRAYDVLPKARRIAGVEGNALLCNGFTTRIIVPAALAPQPKDAFTIDLWLAPAAYPKSRCPIVWRQDTIGTEPAGYSLCLDVHGHVMLEVKGSGGYVKLATADSLHLGKWTRITCKYDAAKGAAIAFNGKEKAHCDKAAGHIIASTGDMWIGRTPRKMKSWYENKDIPIYSSLDAAIDNLDIVGNTMRYDKVTATLHRQPAAPPFEKRRLPSGPERLAFGGWYIPLRFHSAWDEQWRGELDDVVVGFGEQLPFRVVFWRGISYAPCFVTERGNWLSNEFVERKKVTNWGCCESMSDKHADFSSVRIVENSPARTVIKWRNAPVGVNLRLPYQNKETGWGDWSEETYVFYPDGAGVRRVDLWSDSLGPWHEWSQTLQVLHPDQRPEDVLDKDRIMSVANMQGEACTYGWVFDCKATQHMPTMPGANIQVNYLKSRWNPFLILDDRAGLNDHGNSGPEIVRYAGRWSKCSDFPWRNHWPVVQDYVIGRYAVAPDGPAHTYTATQYSAAYMQEDGHLAKVMMCGCTDKDAAGLLPLAKSWLRAPEMEAVGASEAPRYDLAERAYKLEADGRQPLVLRIKASADSPVNGIAIVVKGWQGGMPAIVEADGRSLGDKCRCGIVERYDGRTLVVWADICSDKPVEMVLKDK